MNQLSLLAIIEYRNKSLDTCKQLVKEGRVIEANVILEQIEKNVLELLKDGS
jgi:hypothetical protein